MDSKISATMDGGIWVNTLWGSNDIILGNMLGKYNPKTGLLLPIPQIKYGPCMETTPISSVDMAICIAVFFQN
jgi:hypothetical protein